MFLSSQIPHLFSSLLKLVDAFKDPKNDVTKNIFWKVFDKAISLANGTKNIAKSDNKFHIIVLFNNSKSKVLLTFYFIYISLIPNILSDNLRYLPVNKKSK